MPTKASISDLDNAIAEILDGGFPSKVAKRHHASILTICKRAKSRGISLPVFQKKNTLPPEVIDKYIEGQSVLSLSKQYGVSRTKIARFLLMNNIDCRNGSEANYVRMSKMTSEERHSLVEKAHNARRGTTESEAVLIQKAIHKQSLSCFFGPGENKFYEALCSAGFKPVRQKAVNIYNIDFAIGSVAVELTIGTVKYQGRATNELKRIKKCTDLGYRFFLIEAPSIDVLTRYIEQIISDLQVFCSNPPPAGQYWMIRCRAEKNSTFRNELGQFANIETPKKFQYWRGICDI